jgi:hypothetical protein
MVLLTPSGGGFSIGTSAAPSDNNMEKSLGKLIDENNDPTAFAMTRKHLYGSIISIESYVSFLN